MLTTIMNTVPKIKKAKSENPNVKRNPLEIYKIKFLTLKPVGFEIRILTF